MEDNTPVLASMSAAVQNGLLAKRKRAEKFVEAMLGEEEGQEEVQPAQDPNEKREQGAMSAVNPEAVSSKNRPIDTAVFYYPGIDDGIMVYGKYNNLKDTFAQFFRENLPAIMPEAGQFKDLPVNKLTQKALSAGMVVVMGSKNVVTSIMAARPFARLPDGGSAVEDAFDSAESELMYMPSYGSISGTQYPISQIAPQLKWLASAQ